MRGDDEAVRCEVACRLLYVTFKTSRRSLMYLQKFTSTDVRVSRVCTWSVAESSVANVVDERREEVEVGEGEWRRSVKKSCRDSCHHSRRSRHASRAPSSLPHAFLLFLLPSRPVLPSSILARSFLNPPPYQKECTSTYYLYLPYLVHTVNIHGCTSYSRLS